MASISPRLCRIKQHIELHLPAEDILKACHEAGYRFRRRVLDPVLTVQILILQLLESVSIRGAWRAARLGITIQAIAQARGRLPLAVMLQLTRGLSQKLCAALGAEPDWHGHRLVLLDGTCARVDDTPELAGHYGKARNQRGLALGCPNVRLLALLDASTGLIRKIISMPYCRSEQRGFGHILRHLLPGDLLLADRGLVSFAHLALLQAKRVSFCIRLPRCMVVQGRRGKGSQRKERQLGRRDMLVQWHRPKRRPCWLSLVRFKKLPEQLLLRQISFQLKRKGFRSIWAWVITDRSDTRKYPALELAKLYGKRWQVEVDFRDLKSTLGMKHLRSRSIPAVRKELAAFVILYNLIRQTMLASARLQHVDVNRISFIDAADWLLCSEPGEQPCDLVVNPMRHRKTQPRLVKDYRRNFGRLAHPRALLERPAYEVAV